MPEPDDQLDRMLAASRPSTRAGEVSDDALRALLAGATKESGRSRRRGGLHGAAVGTVIVLSLVGVGSAAAAILPGPWDPWAIEESHAAMTYQLPSGTWCERRWGGYAGTPEISAAAERIAKELGDPLDHIDMKEAIERYRAFGADTAIDESGQEVAAGYGTKYWNADEEYDSVLGLELTELMFESLTAEGLDTGDLRHFKGQSFCEDGE